MSIPSSPVSDTASVSSAAEYSPTTGPGGRAEVLNELRLANAKLTYLNRLDPLLIDISLREPCFASPIGHTLQNKLDILPMVDEFGAKEKIIATLDYQFPEEDEVEDDFCKHLRDTGYNMQGCYAMTDVGEYLLGGDFQPTISMKKLVEYRIPNTVHEITLLPKVHPDQVLRNLGASIDWLRTNVPGCRIYMNVLDLVDTLLVDMDYACTVLELLAARNVEAVSFEDDRGTFFPFQIAAAVRSAKAILNPNQKVLFHCHTGNGMENASVLEALLAGVDGYWGGMERESSTIGHASLGELIANLHRAGNPNMARNYKLQRLLPICESMHTINTGEKLPPQTWPMEGSNAYRTVLSFFRQQATVLMDLPPDQIGKQYGFRIAPVGSDIPVMQGRFNQIGIQVTDDIAKKMILLMRGDMRQGQRKCYDQEDEMHALYQRALDLPAS